MRGTQALFSLPAAIAVRVLHPPPAGRVTRRQATASREPRIERLKELVKFPGKRRLVPVRYVDLVARRANLQEA